MTKAAKKAERVKKAKAAQEKRWKLGGLVLVIGLVVLLCYCWYATRPLDRIQNYEVDVAPQEDGSLMIRYHLEWEVLDSSREGPLTWVKIGLANPNHEITSYGGAVRSIRNGSGLYAELNLDQSYYRGDVADFWFVVRQENMLCRDEENPLGAFYDFTPGWFNAIDIEHYRFTWYDALGGITSHDADQRGAGVLIWEGSLKKGESERMIVHYDLTAFDTATLVNWSPSGASISNNDGPSVDPTVLLLIGIGTIWVAWVMVSPGGSYGRGRGYYHRGGYGGGSTGCACACAGCACACACAGGGRAGCSTKDFFRKRE